VHELLQTSLQLLTATAMRADRVTRMAPRGAFDLAGNTHRVAAALSLASAVVG